MFGPMNRLASTLAILCLVAVTACTAQYQNHGYVPPEEELTNLIVGVDSRATVDDVIGAPSTSGVLGGGDYYYVRSRVREYGMMRPKEVERQIVAISFNADDSIANIERFSLEDGRVVPLTRRVTDSSVLGKGFLKQMLGNFGNIDPSQMFQ